MAGPTDLERAISRRRFLAMGGAAAGAGVLSPWLDPLSALAGTVWPQGRLAAPDAVRVKQSQFMPVGQFRSWHAALDRVGPSNQRGLRATGSPAHEAYIDELYDDLAKAGVEGLRFESVPMTRWTVDRWSLRVLNGSEAGPVTTAAYVPYTHGTPARGVSGELVHVEPGTTPAPGSLAGKIAVIDVEPTVLPLSFFAALAYGDRVYDPRGEFVGDYDRPYLAQIHATLDAAEESGAAGLVAVLDHPFASAVGTYRPYDGVIHGPAGVYVDRATGARLKELARAGGVRARLTLPATVRRVTTRNLYGFISGRSGSGGAFTGAAEKGLSSELITLHSHTDGSNALEDNGPMAMVAMAQYLARLPRNAIPRTIMVLLTGGHFAGGNAQVAWLRRHRNGLVRRTNAALTLEHLGALEWNERSNGRMALTGRYEPSAMFMPGARGLADASYAALRRAGAAPGAALKPLDPSASGTALDPAWPGDGQYLYAQGGIPTSNYITGPTYLLNWGIPTVDKTDFNVVRREAIAFTEMILRLSRTPRASLRRYTLQ